RTLRGRGVRGGAPESEARAGRLLSRRSGPRGGDGLRPGRGQPARRAARSGCRRGLAVTPAAPLRIGTRGSSLALWQTEHVRALLDSAGHHTERIEIRTTGDLVQQVPLARIGSRALFT